jgi:hypothetical protein
LSLWRAASVDETIAVPDALDPPPRTRVRKPNTVKWPKTKPMQALRDLYQTHIKRFAQFVNSFPNEHFNGPLLMEPSAYFQQPRKLLVVGQQTYGGRCEYGDIDAQLEWYRKFNMGGEEGKPYYASPFWNVTRKVESILGIERYSCAWSNLNRFDHDGGAPKGKKILEEISKLDFLVREEIRILKPDICLFYTNWKRDPRIKALYPGVQFHNVEGLPSGHFARLIHDALPDLTLRTPHPRTIRMQKWEDAFLKFMQEWVLEKPLGK